MESINYSRFISFIEGVVGRIACKFGDHSYTWKLERGEKVSISGNPPDRATCRYCKKTFSEAQPDIFYSWISVGDKLPDTTVLFKEFLVYDTLNNKVGHDYWNNEQLEWNHYQTHVTHWMPLPKPPSEAGND